MSFRVGSNTQFTSELINFLKPKNDLTNQLPNGTNYGDYLYWNGSTFAVGDSNVTIGAHAGENSQYDNAVAIGNTAGSYSQGTVAVAIGAGAGNQNQGPASVAIGSGAGSYNQGLNGGSGPYQCCSIAIGTGAGETNQGFFSVAIGPGAGANLQTPGSIALGFMAGSENQGGATGGMNCCSIAIGVSSGQTNQGMSAISVGQGAGMIEQGNYSMAFGNYAGAYGQGTGAVAIGNGAGSYTQGDCAIAIGNGAGFSGQSNNSIVINATGSNLNNYGQGTCVIAPVRDTNPSEPCFVEPYLMSYSPSTAELTYNSNPQILRNFGQGNELLLSDYNTTHYYSYYSETPLSQIDIGTNMVENSVYEVTFNTSGSTASNNDMNFLPNYSNYNNLYTNFAQSMLSGMSFVNTLSGKYNQGNTFSFDLVGGGYGYDPIGKITIFNYRNAKKIRVEVGDTCAISTGAGYWLSNESSAITPQGATPLSYDTETQWLTVGSLIFGNPSFTNVIVTVKRVI
uniref:Trimeric autotransporter adhesin YadA-like head domain-containing protein n=1 Tax=viral metagenome TaxID=1070528 RepID=A0A6C0KHX8_9ZZZZ